jgi:hypothetical protein
MLLTRFASFVISSLEEGKLSISHLWVVLSLIGGKGSEKATFNCILGLVRSNLLMHAIEKGAVSVFSLALCFFALLELNRMFGEAKRPHWSRKIAPYRCFYHLVWEILCQHHVSPESIILANKHFWNIVEGKNTSQSEIYFRCTHQTNGVVIVFPRRKRQS